MVEFFLNSLLLGVGLTMDAFSVSIADGLQEPQMKKCKVGMIALTFAIFQFAMPIIGWFCVHEIVNTFEMFRKAVPWIALLLLSFIGGKMIYENIKKRKKKEAADVFKVLGWKTLLIQGIATSIDALSVGFTIADYDIGKALLASFVIAIVTFSFCLTGLIFGKKISSKLSSYAELLGGLILIGIGLEIFISNLIA